MVTADAEQYCARVEISTGDTSSDMKCSQYPYCEDKSGLNPLGETCVCGHSMESDEDYFEFYNCNSGFYCSGDPELEYYSGDLRCAGYADAVMTFVFSGLSTQDAADSATSVQHVMVNHLDIPSETRVIFESASWTTRRRVDTVVASYRVSPMETEDAASNLLDELAAMMEEFLSALNAELSSNFQKEIIVTGMTIGEEELYNNPDAAGSNASSGVSITMILIIGVGLLAVLLMCFIACKMRENKRLREEMLKEDGTMDYNQDFSDSPSADAVFVAEFGHEQRATPYSPSSSGPCQDEGGFASRPREAEKIDVNTNGRKYGQEEGEVSPKRRKHASKSSRSMRLVTAGAFGETADDSEYELSEIHRGTGENTPSIEKQSRAVFRLPMTPPKVVSPLEVQPMDSIVLPIHTSGGVEPVGSELSEGISIYGRPDESRGGRLTGERSIEQSRGVLPLRSTEGNQVRSDFKSDNGDGTLVTVPLGDERPRFELEDTTNLGSGTNI